MIVEPSKTEYEFTQGQNETISRLAGAMKFVAIVELVMGILLGVLAVFALLQGALGNLIVYGIDSVITIILAVILSNASNYFRNVVTTEGSDVMHLMGALEHLRSYFSIKRVLYIIAMALIAVGIVLAILLFMGRRSEVKVDRYGSSSSTMPLGLSAGAV